MAQKAEKNSMNTKVADKPKMVSKPQTTGVSKSKAPVKNVIVSYHKIDDDLKLELARQYPDGYLNFVRRYPKPNGEVFFAVPLDVDDMHYLIKVEVKIDNLITEDDFDKHFGEIGEVDSKVIGDVEPADDDHDEPDDQKAADDDDEEEDE